MTDSMERLAGAVSAYGDAVRRKLANPAATGQPEDQLRGPLEALFTAMAEITGVAVGRFAMVGESSLADLRTRPDYAVTVSNALCGFVEVKAPGKGADPRRFRDAHDRAQWEKLKAIPNLVYTDGAEFALLRDGELVMPVVRLDGDLERSGARLTAPGSLLMLAEAFFGWAPVAPRSVKGLAETSARLCRLMRDEVAEQLERGSEALTSLAEDWRRLLFPDASDETFADGYAQAVTFGLLIARARGITLATGFDTVGRELATTSSLIGTALRLLTDDVENRKTLETSLGTLVRMLDVVDWSLVSRGDADAWLYFYEDFLETYDNALRKRTGSYYTPPQVVEAMVRLTDDALRTRFAAPRGFAAANVTVADPAVGTGTYLLGVLRRIAMTIEADEGAGAVAGAIHDAIPRLVAFELQFGPFAVAQLRLIAEFVALTGTPPDQPLRMFVTDTLGDPNAEIAYMPALLRPISESLVQANSIKRDERITVVIGNPPYKEKAKGLGAWVESGAEGTSEGLLKDWIPPAEWGVSAHAKHLRNLYVYFWRWATWKVFDQLGANGRGVVAYITVAGFLNGPGFQRMREYLRRQCDEVWVIDCSPEGYQPEVATRIFQGVQQPICIVLASRSASPDPATPAVVRHVTLPPGPRAAKVTALAALQLDGGDWAECQSDWRAPFLPTRNGAWVDCVPLKTFFEYDGSGVMPGRTWVVAPDTSSLSARWQALQRAPVERRAVLFHPHLRGGQPGDRHIDKTVRDGLPGHEFRASSARDDVGGVVAPVRYAYRSFDRQWIIPDARLINQPNPTLWDRHSSAQVYLTALERVAPSAGPAITFAGHMPDLDHYRGSFGGRVYPLWADRDARTSNINEAVRVIVERTLGTPVAGEDLFAYIAAIATHPAYIRRFAADLVQPGLRIPVTADAVLFAEAVALGREVVWMHTYGERFVDPAAGRPAGAPRLPAERAPRIPAEGAIPRSAEYMPDEITHDAVTNRLHVGGGFVDNVTRAMWEYEVSGKQVVKQWFSYRRKTRERPLIGDRRPPSPLGEIQPDHWLPEYTTDLLDLLHVLGRLLDLEPMQASLLERIAAGPLVTAAELETAVAAAAAAAPARPTTRGRGRRSDAAQGSLLD